MSNVVFTTVHGSRLYGLDHAGSDKDSMIVYNDGRPVKQKKTEDEDVIHVGITTLMERAAAGQPQFLEAVFSQKKIWENITWKPMVDNWYGNPQTARETHQKLVHRLCFDEFKYRRHAVRLAANLFQLSLNGRFNPTLTLDEKIKWGAVAANYEGQYLWRILVGAFL